MRIYKKSISTITLLIIILLIYIIYQNFSYVVSVSKIFNHDFFCPKNSEIISELVNKTALVSASFENPSQTMKKLKEKFSDLILNSSFEAEPNDQKSDSQINTNSQDISSDINSNLLNNTTADISEIDSQNQNTLDPDAIEFVPEEFRGIIIEENFKGGQFPLYINTSPGFLANRTKIPSETLRSQIQNMGEIKMQINEDPLVLLFSTHATESFEPIDRNFYDKRYNSRSTDNDKNVTQIEDQIAQELSNHGINTIVDKTQHDFPSYNGSYNRSATTINSYMKKYPSIKIVLDIHRDAIERDNGERVKPVAMINNKKAAQIMIISGCDDGSMNFPHWADNLNFAIDLQRQLENNYPGLTRPIFFCYRKYNMNLSPCSLLIEFGSNSNSMQEVLYSGKLMGKALAELILSYNQ